MIFDDVLGQTVLFGGLGQVPLNDLFLYDGATDEWVSGVSGVPCDTAGDFGPPEPRDGHALVYDGFNRLYWSFGGSHDVCPGAARTAAGGTWYYDPATRIWASLDGPHWGYVGPSPSGRVSPATAYSPAARAVVLFGGDPTLNDTWVLDVRTRTWAQAIAPGVAGSPPAVLGVTGAMVYDPDHDLFILFGGRCGTCPTGEATADTWIYRLSTNSWTKISPLTASATRWSMTSTTAWRCCSAATTAAAT